MHKKILIVPSLLFALLVSGCGGSSADTAASNTSPASSSTVTSSSSTPTDASPTSDASAADCPTTNTRSFAKTRFATDIGGSLFLMNRYLLQPYQKGAFTKGASGRTRALIKAGLAAAGTAKLLNNAKENAKANPTLCKTVAGPLTKLSGSLSGIVDGLKSGSVNTAALGGISGLLGTVKDSASKAGIPITEKQVGIGG